MPWILLLFVSLEINLYFHYYLPVWIDGLGVNVEQDEKKII